MNSNLKPSSPRPRLLSWFSSSRSNRSTLKKSKSTDSFGNLALPADPFAPPPPKLAEFEFETQLASPSRLGIPSRFLNRVSGKWESSWGRTDERGSGVIRTLKSYKSEGALLNSLFSSSNLKTDENGESIGRSVRKRGSIDELSSIKSSSPLYAITESSLASRSKRPTRVIIPSLQSQPSVLTPPSASRYSILPSTPPPSFNLPTLPSPRPFTSFDAHNSVNSTGKTSKVKSKYRALSPEIRVYTENSYKEELEISSYKEELEISPLRRVSEPYLDMDSDDEDELESLTVQEKDGSRFACDTVMEIDEELLMNFPLPSSIATSPNSLDTFSFTQPRAL